MPEDKSDNSTPPTPTSTTSQDSAQVQKPSHPPIPPKESNPSVLLKEAGRLPREFPTETRGKGDNE